MALFRRKRSETDPVPFRRVPSAEMVSARNAFAQIEQRVVTARAIEITDAINLVRDLYFEQPIDACRDGLRDGFSSASVEANPHEIDAIAHVISTGEMDHPIQSFRAVDGVLTPSERASISMKQTEIAQIVRGAAERSLENTRNDPG
jgi:hypothetical protein